MRKLIVVVVIAILIAMQTTQAHAGSSEKQDATNMLHCKLTATAHEWGLTRITYRDFEIQEADMRTLSNNLKERAMKAKSDGSSNVEITCKTVNNASIERVYKLKY